MLQELNDGSRATADIAPKSVCLEDMTILDTVVPGTRTAGFILTPNWALGDLINAAKNYLNRTPFGFRFLRLVVRGGVCR
jgi:hypothetical protein